jgi:hypothetical protein
MKKRKVLPEVMNGFKIVQDLGCYKNRARWAIVKCKFCGKKFETNIYNINNCKGCGCQPTAKFRALPDMINGFKIIKDLGYDRNLYSRSAFVECKICKREYKINPWSLIYRNHCECVKRGKKVSKFTHSHKRLLNTFNRMKARCYNNKNEDYYNYGGRGITICNEWLVHPDVFCEWALKNGYKENLSIDRINNDKGYSPENCKWSTPTQQSRNRKGVKLSMEIAKKIRKDFKLNPNKTYKEISKSYSVGQDTIGLIIRNKIWVKS